MDTYLNEYLVQKCPLSALQFSLSFFECHQLCSTFDYRKSSARILMSAPHCTTYILISFLKKSNETLRTPKLTVRNLYEDVMNSENPSLKLSINVLAAGSAQSYHKK